MPGLIIIVIWVSDIFYGHDAIEGTVYKEIAVFVGKDAALQVQETIRNASLSGDSGFATIVGLVTLILGATSVFSEIQDSINLIWRLKARPKKGRGWLKLIINRLLSFSMIITLGFLLLVSLLINGLMDAFINHLTQLFPQTQVAIAYGFNLVFTFLITSFLFAIIFKVLPDARIKWRHVRAGAFTTALLFMLGRFIIGYYLGHSKMSSAYGAAGSIIVILLWVYYSSIILYFGAAFTRVYAIHRGSHIYPTNYAVWIEQVEVESRQALDEQATAEQKEKKLFRKMIIPGSKKLSRFSFFEPHKKHKEHRIQHRFLCESLCCILCVYMVQIPNTKLFSIKFRQLLKSCLNLVFEPHKHHRHIETHIEFYVLSLCFLCPMWFEYPIRKSFQLDLDSF